MTEKAAIICWDKLVMYISYSCSTATPTFRRSCSFAYVAIGVDVRFPAKITQHGDSF
jgi:hypothetical protein